jgi:type II pantothenate kinase
MKIPQVILEKLSLAGNRKNLDSLIGEVVNDIGSLHPEVTASNFEKARYGDDHSDGDIAASLSNMVGEIIGTISYLNALLMGVSEVFFIGRVGNLEVVRSGITDRLALANIKGNFDSQSGFGNALGVMFFLNKES